MGDIDGLEHGVRLIKEWLSAEQKKERLEGWV
jgi:hypothetical protein